MAEGIVLIGALAALNVLALFFGKDTRDENDWVRHNHIR